MNRLILPVRIMSVFCFIASICGISMAQTTPLTSCSEDKNMIIGVITLDSLEQNTAFWSEYLANYAAYSIDEKKVEEISNVLNNNNSRRIYIIAVIGTWCGDTKEQFPVLEKILDRLQHNDISHNSIRIIYVGVDRDKLAGKTDISSWNIEFVPTFIFYENSQELGRIIETPEGTMEEHILKILSKK